MPIGILKIKIMKCVGFAGALGILDIAQLAGIDLMLGCMDKSVISILAALYTPCACPQTRYLDLDGSFDFSSDTGMVATCRIGAFQTPKPDNLTTSVLETCQCDRIMPPGSVVATVPIRSK